MKRTIVITGGAGFIGSHVVRLFVNKYPEYHIINLDKLTYAGNLANLKDIEDKPNYEFVKMDICDFDAFYQLMQDKKVDGIIHLAAESHVDRSIKDPFTFAKTNVMGTLSLLQAAKLYWESLPEKYEGKRFYHISTDEVYGALELTHPEGIEPPFTTTASSAEHHLAYGDKFFMETTKYNPHSPYSASKASSDHFVRAFHDTYGMPVIVTNCSNNYGPYQFPEKLIPLFINNIRHRKPLPVYGKGENVRDWLFVEDHARAIDLIFHEGKTADTYNIGGFNEWSTSSRLLSRPSTVCLAARRAKIWTSSPLSLTVPATTCAMPSTRRSCKRNWVGNLRSSSRRVSRKQSVGIWTTKSGWTMSPQATIRSTTKICIRTDEENSFVRLR